MNAHSISRTNVFWRRGIALLLSLTVLLMDLGECAPSVYANTSPNPSAHSHQTPQQHLIDIPIELATIEESHKGTNGKTILFIQDAHDSLEAQENIAKLIHHTVEQENVRTVLEEGYEGEVPTDEYFEFVEDAEVKRKVSYFLLDKLRIGGAEYAHINRTTDFKLLGVDRRDLHDENIEWYRQLVSDRKRTDKDLKRLRTKLKRLVQTNFPKTFKDWLRLKKRFNHDELGMLDYLQRSMALLRSVHSLPNIQLLLLANSTADPRLLEEIQSISTRTLFEEIHLMEKMISHEQLKDDVSRELFLHIQRIDLIQRMSKIQINSDEYEVIKKMLRGFSTEKVIRFINEQTDKPIVASRVWEENIEHAMRFYEIANKRHEVLGKYLTKFRDESQETNAVLVYGGFHRNGIVDLLKQYGYSYQIVTPVISQISKRHQKYYRRLLSTGQHAFEVLPSLARAVVVKRAFVVLRNRSEMRAYLQANLPKSLRNDLAIELARFARKQIRSEVRTDANVQYFPMRGKIDVPNGKKRIRVHAGGKKREVVLFEADFRVKQYSPPQTLDPSDYDQYPGPYYSADMIAREELGAPQFQRDGSTENVLADTRFYLQKNSMVLGDRQSDPFPRFDTADPKRKKYYHWFYQQRLLEETIARNMSGINRIVSPTAKELRRRWPGQVVIPLWYQWVQQPYVYNVSGNRLFQRLLWYSIQFFNWAVFAPLRDVIALFHDYLFELSAKDYPVDWIIRLMERTGFVFYSFQHESAQMVYDQAMESFGYVKKKLDEPMQWERGITLTEAWVKELTDENRIEAFEPYVSFNFNTFQQKEVHAFKYPTNIRRDFPFRRDPRIQEIRAAMEEFQQQEKLKGRVLAAESEHGAYLRSSIELLEDFIRSRGLGLYERKVYQSRVRNIATVVVFGVVASVINLAGFALGWGLFFAAIAAFYAFYFIMSHYKTVEARWKKLQRRLLEVGTGDGLTAFYLAAYTGLPTTSIEVDETRYQYAKDFETFLAEKKGIVYPNLTIKKVNFLDFDASSYDEIYFAFTGPKDSQYEFAAKVLEKLDEELKQDAVFHSPFFAYDDRGVETVFGEFYRQPRSLSYTRHTIDHDIDVVQIQRMPEYRARGNRSEVRTVGEMSPAPGVSPAGGGYLKEYARSSAKEGSLASVLHSLYDSETFSEEESIEVADLGLNLEDKHTYDIVEYLISTGLVYEDDDSRLYLPPELSDENVMNLIIASHLEMTEPFFALPEFEALHARITSTIRDVYAKEKREAARRDAATEYLTGKLGIDLHPEYPKSKVSWPNGSERQVDHVLRERLVQKAQRIARDLRLPIGIHVLPSRYLRYLPNRHFSGDTYVLTPEVLAEKNIATDEEAAGQFVWDTLLTLSGAFSMGFQTKEVDRTGKQLEPSTPVMLFIEDEPDVYETRESGLVNNHFVVSSPLFGYQDKARFEDRLHGVETWSYRDITGYEEGQWHRDTEKDSTSLSYEIVDRYFDQLLNIIANQKAMNVDLSNSTVLLLPGSGEQLPKMGKQLYESNLVYQGIIDRASAALGFDLADVIYGENAEENLKDPRYFMPAITATSVALYRALQADLGRELDVGAIYGMSVGQVAAYIIAHSISLEDGMRLTQVYAQEAHRIARNLPGEMVLVAGVDKMTLDKLVTENQNIDLGIVYGLSRGRLFSVLSGRRGEVTHALSSIGDRGIQLLDLNTGGMGAHSALFRQALLKIRNFLLRMDVSPPRVPVVGNIRTDFRRSPTQIRAALTQHLYNTISFQGAIRALQDRGARRYLELGARNKGFLLRFVGDESADKFYVNAPEGEPVQLNRLIEQFGGSDDRYEGYLPANEHRDRPEDLRSEVRSSAFDEFGRRSPGFRPIYFIRNVQDLAGYERFKQMRRWFNPALHEMVHQTFVPTLNPGDTVLEVGAGTGTLREIVGDRFPQGARWIETDIWSRVLNVPRPYATERLVSALPHLEVDNDTATHIVGLSVLDNISLDQMRDSFDEMFRKLQAGGLLFHFQDLFPSLGIELEAAIQRNLFLIPFHSKPNQARDEYVMTGFHLVDANFLRFVVMNYREGDRNAMSLALDQVEAMGFNKQEVLESLRRYIRTPIQEIFKLEDENKLEILRAYEVISGSLGIIRETHMSAYDRFTKRLQDTAIAAGFELDHSGKVLIEAAYGNRSDFPFLLPDGDNQIAFEHGAVFTSRDEQLAADRPDLVRVQASFRILILKKPEFGRAEPTQIRQVVTWVDPAGRRSDQSPMSSALREDRGDPRSEIRKVEGISQELMRNLFFAESTFVGSHYTQRERALKMIGPVLIEWVRQGKQPDLRKIRERMLDTEDHEEPRFEAFKILAKVNVERVEQGRNPLFIDELWDQIEIEWFGGGFFLAEAIDELAKIDMARVRNGRPPVFLETFSTKLKELELWTHPFGGVFPDSNAVRMQTRQRALIKAITQINLTAIEHGVEVGGMDAVADKLGEQWSESVQGEALTALADVDVMRVKKGKEAVHWSHAASVLQHDAERYLQIKAIRNQYRVLIAYIEQKRQDSPIQPSSFHAWIAGPDTSESVSGEVISALADIDSALILAGREPASQSVLVERVGEARLGIRTKVKIYEALGRIDAALVHKGQEPRSLELFSARLRAEGGTLFMDEFLAILKQLNQIDVAFIQNNQSPRSTALMLRLLEERDQYALPVVYQGLASMDAALIRRPNDPGEPQFLSVLTESLDVKQRNLRESLISSVSEIHAALIDVGRHPDPSKVLEVDYWEGYKLGDSKKLSSIVRRLNEKHVHTYGKPLEGVEDVARTGLLIDRGESEQTLVSQDLALIAAGQEPTAFPFLVEALKRYAVFADDDSSRREISLTSLLDVVRQINVALVENGQEPRELNYLHQLATNYLSYVKRGTRVEWVTSGNITSVIRTLGEIDIALAKQGKAPQSLGVLEPYIQAGTMQSWDMTLSVYADVNRTLLMHGGEPRSLDFLESFYNGHSQMHYNQPKIEPVSKLFETLVRQNKFEDDYFNRYQLWARSRLPFMGPSMVDGFLSAGDPEAYISQIKREAEDLIRDGFDYDNAEHLYKVFMGLQAHGIDIPRQEFDERIKYLKQFDQEHPGSFARMFQKTAGAKTLQVSSQYTRRLDTASVDQTVLDRHLDKLESLKKRIDSLDWIAEDFPEHRRINLRNIFYHMKRLEAIESGSLTDKERFRIDFPDENVMRAELQQKKKLYYRVVFDIARNRLGNQQQVAKKMPAIQDENPKLFILLRDLIISDVLEEPAIANRLRTGKPELKIDLFRMVYDDFANHLPGSLGLRIPKIKTDDQNLADVLNELYEEIRPELAKAAIVEVEEEDAYTLVPVGFLGVFRGRASLIDSSYDTTNGAPFTQSMQEDTQVYFVYKGKRLKGYVSLVMGQDERENKILTIDTIQSAALDGEELLMNLLKEFNDIALEQGAVGIALPETLPGPFNFENRDTIADLPIYQEAIPVDVEPLHKESWEQLEEMFGVDEFGSHSMTSGNFALLRFPNSPDLDYMSFEKGVKAAEEVIRQLELDKAKANTILDALGDKPPFGWKYEELGIELKDVWAEDVPGLDGLLKGFRNLGLNGKFSFAFHAGHQDGRGDIITYVRAILDGIEEIKPLRKAVKQVGQQVEGEVELNERIRRDLMALGLIEGVMKEVHKTADRRSEVRFPSNLVPGWDYDSFVAWRDEMKSDFERERKEAWDSYRDLTENSIKYTELVDTYIHRIRKQAIKLYGWKARRTTFIGRGSYGRREMLEPSDIDGRILIPREKGYEDVVAFFQRASLEIFGEKALWQPMTLDDDINVLTDDEDELSLVTESMDNRFVAGSRGMFYEKIFQFQAHVSAGKARALYHLIKMLRRLRFFAGVFMLDFWQALFEAVLTLFDHSPAKNEKLTLNIVNLWNKRYQRYGFAEGLYEREPKVKEGVGGLRAMHFSRWIAAAYTENLEDPLGALEKRGVITKRERIAAQRAFRFISRVRQTIYRVSGSTAQADVLSFQVQLQVAKELKFDLRAGGHSNPQALFMSEYYRQSQNLFFFSSRIARRVAERIQPPEIQHLLDADTPVPGVVEQERNGRIFRLGVGFAHVEQDRVLAARNETSGISTVDLEPEHIMPLFLYAAERGLPMNGHLRDSLQFAYKNFKNRMKHDYNFRVQVRKQFWELLQGKKGKGSYHAVSYVISRMKYIGYLDVILPELGKFTASTSVDINHRYTLDAHALRALELLDDLAFSSEPDSRVERIREAMDVPLAWLPRGEGLYGIIRLAILLKPLHDFEPEQIDNAFVELGVDEKSRERVLFLLNNQQLLISHTRSGGLSDPERLHGIITETLQSRYKRWPLLVMLTLINLTVTNPERGWVFEQEFAAASRVAEDVMDDTQVIKDRIIENERTRRATLHMPFVGVPEDSKETHIAVIPLDVEGFSVHSNADIGIVHSKIPGEWETDRIARISAVLNEHGLEVKDITSKEMSDGKVYDRVSVKARFNLKQAHTVWRHLRDILRAKLSANVNITETELGALADIVVYRKDAKDGPGHFAKIAGVLTANGLEIVAAETGHSEEGAESILDRITVRGSFGKLESDHNWQVIERNLTEDLNEVFDSESPKTVKEIFEKRYQSYVFNIPSYGQEEPAFPIPVGFVAEAFDENTTRIEVQANDFPGVLYVMLEVLASRGINLHVHSHVDTEGYDIRVGKKAVNTFIVDYEGGRVPGPLIADLMTTFQQVLPKHNIKEEDMMPEKRSEVRFAGRTEDRSAIRKQMIYRLIYPKYPLRVSEKSLYKSEFFEQELEKKTEPVKRASEVLKATLGYAYSKTKGAELLHARFRRLMTGTTVIAVDLPKIYFHPGDGMQVSHVMQVSFRRRTIVFSRKFLQALEPNNEYHLAIVAMYLNEAQRLLDLYDDRVEYFRNEMQTESVGLAPSFYEKIHEEIDGILNANLEFEEELAPLPFVADSKLPATYKQLMARFTRADEILRDKERTAVEATKETLPKKVEAVREVLRGWDPYEGYSDEQIPEVSRRIREVLRLPEDPQSSDQQVAIDGIRELIYDLQKLAFYHENNHEHAEAIALYDDIVEMFKAAQKIDFGGFFPVDAQRAIIYFLIRVGHLRGFKEELERYETLQYIPGARQVEQKHNHDYNFGMWLALAVPDLLYKLEFYRTRWTPMHGDPTFDEIQEYLLQLYHRALVEQNVPERKFGVDLREERSDQLSKPLLVHVPGSDDVFSFSWQKHELSPDNIQVRVRASTFIGASKQEKVGFLHFSLRRGAEGWEAHVDYTRDFTTGLKFHVDGSDGRRVKARAIVLTDTIRDTHRNVFQKMLEYAFRLANASGAGDMFIIHLNRGNRWILEQIRGRSFPAEQTELVFSNLANDPLIRSPQQIRLRTRAQRSEVRTLEHYEAIQTRLKALVEERTPSGQGFSPELLKVKIAANAIETTPVRFLPRLFDHRAVLLGLTIEQYRELLEGRLSQGVLETDHAEVVRQEVDVYMSVFYSQGTRQSQNYPMYNFEDQDIVYSQLKDIFLGRLSQREDPKPVIIRFLAVGDGHEMENTLKLVDGILADILGDPPNAELLTRLAEPTKEALARELKLDIRAHDFRPNNLENAESKFQQLENQYDWLKGLTSVRFLNLESEHSYVDWDNESTAFVIARNVFKINIGVAQYPVFLTKIADVLEDGGVYVADLTDAEYINSVRESRAAVQAGLHQNVIRTELKPFVDPLEFVLLEVNSYMAHRGVYDPDYYVQVFKRKTRVRSELRHTSAQTVAAVLEQTFPGTVVRETVENVTGDYAIVLDAHVFDSLSEAQQEEFYALFLAFDESDRVRFVFREDVNMKANARLRETVERLRTFADEFDHVTVLSNMQHIDHVLKGRRVISVSKEGVVSALAERLEREHLESGEFLGVRYRKNYHERGLMTAFMLLLNSEEAAWLRSEIRKTGHGFSEVPKGLIAGIEDFLASYVYIGSSA